MKNVDNTKNIDFTKMSKKEVVMNLYMNTSIQMVNNNIDYEIIANKTVNSVIFNLCNNVIQSSNKERLELLGTNVMSTYIGLGVRVCDMLKGIGIKIENAYDVDATLKQLDAIEGKVVVDNFSY
jgi:hypothetical protein